MKNVYVKDLIEHVGEKIEESFFISDLLSNCNRQGTEWVNVQLSDRTGEVRAKVWSEYQPEFASDKIKECKNRVCRIKGKVDIYNGVAGCAIENMIPLQEGEYDLDDYVVSLPEKLKKEYVKELHSYIDMVEDVTLRTLLNEVFCSRNISMMCELPAGIMNHHAFNGALLVHTLEVTQLALADAECREKFRSAKGYARDAVNRDLLIAGALLHDIGKVAEYKPFPFAQRTKKGRLNGHIGIGVMMLTAYNCGIPMQSRVKDTSELVHIILSSHGEVGGMKPSTLEAVIIHNADMVSASMDGYDSAFREFEKKHPGEDVEYVWSNMLQTKVYRGKNAVEPESGRK